MKLIIHHLQLECIVLLICILILGSCTDQKAQNKESQKFELQKTDAEWRKSLTSEQFKVLRKHETEIAFSGKYNNHYAEGVYHCAACGNELFSSETKFDSGTGWPSFYAPISENHIGTEIDKAYGMVRTEVHCARCGGHLGHVFNDGIEPTGLRYCLNSVALDFKEK